MLIAIEGYDGSGKSTVAKGVADALGCDLVHFPYDEGVTGPLIRGYLRLDWRLRKAPSSDRSGSSMQAESLANALVFQALQVANRMEVMERLFQAADSPSDHLVLDRYWHSGLVYGQLDGLDERFLRTVHRCMAQPNLSILVDVDAETCLERQQARHGAAERYDGDLDLARRAVDLYRELWTREGAPEAAALSELQFGYSEWVMVDGSQSPGAVVADAIALALRVANT